MANPTRVSIYPCVLSVYILTVATSLSLSPYLSLSLYLSLLSLSLSLSLSLALSLARSLARSRSRVIRLVRLRCTRAIVTVFTVPYHITPYRTELRRSS